MSNQYTLSRCRMLATILVTALIFWITAAMAAFAEAPVCNLRNTTVAHLADTYGEQLQMYGLSSDGIVTEFYANPETGSWTLLASNARGISCYVASGELYVMPGETKVEPSGHKL